MTIIGFNFTSIEASADRKGDEKKAGTNVNINSVPNIESIKRKDMKIAGLKDVLAIDFSFATSYDPKIGDISIRGEVLYQTDDAKNIMALWDSKKKIEAKLAADVLNVILKKCLTRAVAIADDLRLPPPVSFPIVAPEKPDAD